MSLCFVYCPYPSELDAQKAVKLFLVGKLCACANIIKSTSVYFWQGDLALEGEFVTIFKTLECKVPYLTAKIKETHPYTIPAIITIKAESVNPEYLEWVEKELELSGN